MTRPRGPVGQDDKPASESTPACPAERLIRGLGSIAGAPRSDASATLRALLTLGREHLTAEIGLITRATPGGCEVVEVVAPDSAGISAGAHLATTDPLCSSSLGVTGSITLAHVELAYVAGPITVDERRLGTLSLMTPGPREAPFERAAIEAVGLLAAWAAVAISRHEHALRFAELNARLESLSGLDPVTHVLNQQAIEAALAAGPRAGSRALRAAVLVSLRAPEGRALEGTARHPVDIPSDGTLAGLADIIREQIRGRDKVARVGRRRLLVLLERACLADALIVAKRIRDAVSASPVATTRGPRLAAEIEVGVTMVRGTPSLARVIAEASAEVRGTLDEPTRARIGAVALAQG